MSFTNNRELFCFVADYLYWQPQCTIVGDDELENDDDQPWETTVCHRNNVTDDSDSEDILEDITAGVTDIIVAV